MIESLKGSRAKLKYDAEYDAFTLSGLLPEGFTFPFDFGFIPSTKSEDGDPLDAMVLLDVPSAVGCIIDCRIIGVVEAEQTEDGKTVRNDRILAMATEATNRIEAISIDELSDSLISELEYFFEAYERGKGRGYKVIARKGPADAATLIERAMRQFEKESKNSPEKK